VQLRITNTLTRQKEPFAPIVPGEVSLYVCGVTVYDFSHVGHARVYVFFDVVQRTLCKLGFKVRYVRNFTDVDDKIIKRANENGEESRALSERFIAAFHEDMAALGCESPDVEPKVTTHMAAIVAMVEQIVARGHAYEVPGETAESRDVYFSIDTFPQYGELSRRQQDDNEAGASDRVAPDPRKRNPADFALWKSAKPGEPWWDSPWGKGRPGWHIECSAMSCKHLGSRFDIHGGGKDLVFPHHENEIAQSKAATGDTFAQRWMHLAFLTIDQEKMSKSLGNFFTIRDVLARFHAQVLRYFLLSAHYLHPLNFSDKALEEANRRVLAVYEKLAAADAWLVGKPATVNGKTAPVVESARSEFWDALCDDFNTPRALAALSEPIAALGQALDKPKAAGGDVAIAEVLEFMRETGKVLGVFDRDPAAVVAEIVEGERQRRFPDGSDERRRIDSLVAERQAARVAKDWPRADVLRDELTNVGVELRDSREGTSWRPLIGGE
jgi:cysteinyl-tRNA synthetase